MSRLTVLMLLCALPGAAIAQEASPPVEPAPLTDPSAHRHLGFYFHVDLGGGYLSTSASQSGFTASAKGASVLVSVAAGGAVAEDWILAGEVWGAAAPSPSGVTSSDATLGLSGFGLNVTHYFMPANVFLTLTPSATVLSVDNGGGTAGRTQIGFGGRLAIGKEWWVGDHWGLGVAAQGYFGINRDQGADAPTWSTFGGGILFSATYN